MSIETIKKAIRNVPNFPKQGIQFKDITTAIKQPQILREILDLTAKHFKNEHIDYVVGIESRGFIFGTALAYLLGCGFIPLRKPNKLPAATIKQEYTLEYGIDCLEIHQDALEKNAKVLIVDDLLATGGTAEAAGKLVLKAGAQIAAFAFVIELDALQGKSKLTAFANVFSLLHY